MGEGDEVGPLIVEAEGRLAAGCYAEAEAPLVRALALTESAADPRRETVLEHLGRVYLEQGRHDLAQRTYRRLVALREADRGASDPATIRAVELLASACFRGDDFAGAEGAYRRALAIRERLGVQDEALGSLLGRFAFALYYVGRYSEAASLYARALAILQALPDPGSPWTAWVARKYAVMVDFRPGFSADPEALYRGALRAAEAGFEPDHVEIAEDCYRLGDFLHRNRPDAAAEVGPLIDRALRIATTSESPPSERTNWVIDGCLEYLRDVGRGAEADQFEATRGVRDVYGDGLRESVVRARAAFGSTSTELAEALINLGNHHAFEDRFDEAEAAFRQALDALTRLHGDDDPRAAGVRKSLDRIEVLRKRRRRG